MSTPKKKAHDAVMWALKQGKLTRPDRCAICQVRCKPDAHHHDYRSLLEVDWLCRHCHKIVHYTEADLRSRSPLEA